jgi:hypothetical protein
MGDLVGRSVIPAKAGIQGQDDVPLDPVGTRRARPLDPRFRGDDSKRFKVIGNGSILAPMRFRGNDKHSVHANYPTRTAKFSPLS